MDTDIAPNPDASVQASLYTLLAPFQGYRYKFLIALIKDPARSHADVCRELGIEPQTAWNWHSMVPGFKQALDAIKEGRADLRTEYAKLAFLEATPKVADAMVKVAIEGGRDAQRAREKVLEVVGVLPKAGDLQPGIETLDYVALRIRRTAK